MGGRPRCDAAGHFALIVVDSSVWIDHFRDRSDSAGVMVLRAAIAEGAAIVVGDLILLELLLGVPNERQAARVEDRLRQFTVETMLDGGLVAQAGRNYRLLRSSGFTVRGTVDLIIGTYCIDRDYPLLHNDRDFEPMHTLLGLRRAV